MSRIGYIRKTAWFAFVFLLAIYLGLVAVRVLYPLRHISLVLEHARQQELDPTLVFAVIYAESRFDTMAVSPSGALGLMQVMPATGAWVAEQLGESDFTPDDLHDPETNIRFGTWYLRQLTDEFSQYETVLQAYNAGPANAADWRQDQSLVFPETRDYVRRTSNALLIYRLYLRFPAIGRITPSFAL